MIIGKAERIESTSVILTKAKAYFELIKFRLSFLVAFSSGFGYVLGVQGNVDWNMFGWFCFGGLIISGASVTINQILEKDYDKLMKRTASRPLPTGRVSVNEAVVFTIILTLAGFGILIAFTNWLTVLMSAISMILYGFVYTPLKRVGPIAVFVGAFPGALPPMLGWIAATGTISLEAMVIFGIQFIWQFPHFWAIAWVADEDYKKAGFKLLPMGGNKSLGSAIQITIYTLFLIPLGLLPAQFGITGISSALVATLCGAFFVFQTFDLIGDYSRKSALKIMYGSFLYLPVVQIAFLMDKI